MPPAQPFQPSAPWCNSPRTQQLDLRIQQGDTSLTFFARPTPAAGGTGNWTTIYTVATSPGLLSYQPSFGLANMGKKGTFYFNQFYLDGVAVGGQAESPVILGIRDAVDSIQSAETDLQETTPDFTDAVTALGAAITSSTTAQASLASAITNKTLQYPHYAPAAEKTLISNDKSLEKIVAEVGKLKASQIKSELKTLNVIAGGEEAVMAEVLTIKTPNLDSAPANFFYLHAPD